MAPLQGNVTIQLSQYPGFNLTGILIDRPAGYGPLLQSNIESTWVIIRDKSFSRNRREASVDTDPDSQVVKGKD